jgi:phosphate/sulfate permease
VELALLIIGLGLAGAYAIAIGSNDMANIIGVVVGSRLVRYRVAVILFATSVILGALLQGYMVMKTLGRGVVTSLDVYGAVAASIAAISWVLLASLFGLPVSTSQSAVSGVLGVGLAYILTTGDWSLVNFKVVERIVLSWVTSPVLAIALSAGLYLVLERAHRAIHTSEKIVKALALFFAGFDGYAFGANDVANATGVYLAVIGASIAGSSALGAGGSLLLALYGAVFIALGGTVLGRKVAETVGYRITRLDPVGSMTSSLVSATSTWIFTTIPYMLFGYGMPVSTTYITVATVIGVGIAKHRSIKGVDLKVIAMILLSWVLTLPVAAVIGLTTYIALVSLRGA